MENFSFSGTGFSFWYFLDQIKQKIQAKEKEKKYKKKVQIKEIRKNEKRTGDLT